MENENHTLRSDFNDLLKIAIESLKFSPPLYLESILGPWYTWLYPHREYSEFTIFDPWKPGQTFGYLRDITVPSLPKKPPRILSLLPPFIKNTFWRPSDYFQQNDPYDSATSFSNEKWFFVNGICTDENVAKMNSELLSLMFRRPITVVHNSTNSFFVDLFQCALGKGISDNADGTPQYMTEPSVKATTAIMDALNAQEIDRVVVICHSQGTIILSNVIKAIGGIINDCRTCSGEQLQNKQLVDKAAADIIGAGEQELEATTINGLKQAIANFLVNDMGEGITETEEKIAYLYQKLAKFEVYAFANCATSMTYIHQEEGKDPFPYIESYANEKDLVARLGAISPENKPGGLVTIDGPIYENSNSWWHRSNSAWGHLLNQHYLFPILDGLASENANPPPYQLVGDNDFSNTPRLYQYFNGGSPAPLKR